MNNYDVIVIGSGSGGIILENAIKDGLSVALIDRGPIGGTCLNDGCIPSKSLIFTADRIMEIHEAHKFDINARIDSVDFSKVIQRARNLVDSSRNHIKTNIQRILGSNYYHSEAHFVNDHVLDVGGKQIYGKKIFIVAGARPYIPEISGINTVSYITYENVLDLRELPESMIIIGGGFIAVEYAHFFDAMGCKVTILQKESLLAPREEPEISALLTNKLSQRMVVETSTDVMEILGKDDEYIVHTKNRKTGLAKEFRAQRLFVASGRVSNADTLNLASTGVEMDKDCCVKVDQFYETTRENIWAFGDVIGNKMFKHVANREAIYAWNNSVNDNKMSLDYDAVPHVIFTHPQVASVGLTEAEASQNRDILVSEAKYTDVAYGQIAMDDDTFGKAIIEEKTGRILGFHVIGPHSSMIIQEVVNAIDHGENVNYLYHPLHTHPTLTEFVLQVFQNLHRPFHL